MLDRSITLLSQNEVGGLQVLTSSGQWIDAPKIKDCILVNTGTQKIELEFAISTFGSNFSGCDAGDIMERWTNGFYKSTLHRVAFNEQSEKNDRYSVVYFCMPNWEQTLEPIIRGEDGSYRTKTNEKADVVLFGDMIPFV